MKYCAFCGKELFDEAVICSGCGCPTDLYHKQNAQQNQQQAQSQTQANVPLTTNTYAILSMVFAFLCPILGIIFGKLGLNDIRKNRNQKGEELAKAGIGVSIAFVVLAILTAILIIVIVAVAVKSGNNNLPSNNQNGIGI